MRSRRDPGRLLQNGDDRTDPLFQRGKVPFDVNIHIQHAGVRHWVLRVNLPIFESKNLALNSILENAIIISLGYAKAGAINGVQPPVKGFEAREFGIQRRAAKNGYFSVVARKSQRGAGLGPPFEIAADVFVSEFGELRISGSRSGMRFVPEFGAAASH